jgi:hypothetical protein
MIKKEKLILIDYDKDNNFIGEDILFSLLNRFFKPCILGI